MISVRHTFWLFAIAASGLIAAGTVGRSLAQENQEKKEASEEKADRYAVPDGDVEQLMEFMDGLKSYRPKSREDFLQHREKSLAAIKKAAAKVLELEKDKSSDTYKKATSYLYEAQARTIDSASPVEQQKILAEIKQRLSEKELTREDLIFAMQLARENEYGGHPELAGKLYAAFAEVFAKSDNQQIAKLSKLFEGSARRLQLLGKSIELTGTKLDGSAFDWASYRGKVVLIDFWATWCGPCRAELPNVKRNYELYHEKGFDVVGISLDEDREALEKFLADEKTPWVTLNDKGGFDSELTRYYGISAIPTVLLADKQGNIVSLNARGDELGNQLEKLLGPAEKAAADK